MTCRTRSYVDDAVLSDFEAVTLAPFDASQIEIFAEAWYTAQKGLGRVDATQAKAKSADLARAALTSDLAELSSNPMLLTAMALIHQKEVGLPRERVRLYSKAVEVLLYRWQQEKVSQAALAAFLHDDRRLRTVMERLAYEAHHAKSDGQTGGADVSRHQAQDVIEDYLDDAQQARAFLDYVDQRAGLLVGRGGRPDRPAEYSFPHRTFQEYLAGCYLLTGSDNDRVAEFYARAAEGDRWSLVAQLGAEELLYNTRNGEQQLLYLAYNLLGNDLASEKDQRAALWAAQMTDLVERRQIERDTRSPNGGPAYLQRLAQQLVTLVAGELPATERVQAGDVLAQLGDPRFRADAWHLPDEDLLGFVEIPAGPFLMGSKKSDQDAEDHEKPQHKLNLPTYYIGRYPVTVGQFAAFVAASGYKPQDRDYRRQGSLNHPVVNVTWADALAYCEWLTEQLKTVEHVSAPLARLIRDENWQVRLPSEAEWEKAARGADGRVYPWGNEFEAGKTNMGETGIGRASAVGSFPSGASPYGVLDMSGNVWEWTRSLWEREEGEKQYTYPYQPKDGRENLDASNDVRRVLRGGGFFYYLRNVRCAFRGWNHPVGGVYNGGFCVVVLPNSEL